MRAIKETGNVLVAALDKHDSVGILDNYFPDADFFTEFERFDRHLEKLKREAQGIDYLVVCSPNYLHDAHIRFGLRLGVDVICEKPVVLNPWNVDALMEMEKETGKRVFTILQMRLHSSIIELREEVLRSSPEKKFDVKLKYVTPRGHWYPISWKGDSSKSGGITTNIGVHFFDLLLWIFGEVRENRLSRQESRKAAGFLELKKARVQWFLSIDGKDLPTNAVDVSSYRSLDVNGKQIEFNESAEDLHVESYKQILKGDGFVLKEQKCLTELLLQLRT
jgi:UDP-N-acetyl-2-amino-2-deoxyglucuronate dehydrogenase